MMKALLAAACLAALLGGAAAQDDCATGGGTCTGTAGYADNDGSDTLCNTDGSTDNCEVGGDDDYVDGGTCCPAADCPTGTTGTDLITGDCVAAAGWDGSSMSMTVTTTSGTGYATTLPVAVACPANTVGSTVVTGCLAVAGYTGTISVASSDTGFTGSAVACGAGTYKSVVGRDACSPCLTLCDADADTAGYSVCPEASVSDTTTLDGSCDFTSLFGLIEDNTATATLLNTLSTAAYGAADHCQKRETLLRCRTVNDAMEAADLVIDSACGGR